MEEQRNVVVFTGLPGTGKSALADRVAASIGAPAFAGDWLMGALHGTTPACSSSSVSAPTSTCTAHVWRTARATAAIP